MAFLTHNTKNKPIAKGTVIFLCAGDPARIHMAEGLLQHLAGERLELYCQGSLNRVFDPDAFFVMKEIGIDISALRLKSVMELGGQRMKYAITICACPIEPCLTFHRAFRPARWSIEDPTLCKGSAEERLQVFRHTRDQIGELVVDFLKRLAWRHRESKSTLEFSDVVDKDAAPSGTINPIKI